MTPERNDPTPAGFTPPAAGIVQLSCNEVEALCLKAARGAGLCWGLAEEAGYAARWLYSHDVDGPGALLAHLDQVAGNSSDLILVDGVIRAKGEGLLCPIAVGAALSDLASAGDDCVSAGPVNRPLLILPFIHQIAHALECPVALYWTGGRVSISAAGAATGELAALAATNTADISIAQETVAAEPASAPQYIAAPATDTLTRLNAYALLTTVPASAASRTDAGSADGDND